MLKPIVDSCLVIEHLHQGSEDEPLAYFYCKADEPERRNPADILRSIVRQLCCQKGRPVMGAVSAIYRDREEDGFADGALTIAESVDLIINLAEHHQTVIIVIDAFDECEAMLRPDFIAALEKVLHQSLALIKIFITSRNNIDIVRRMDAYPDISIMESDTAEDLKRFVEADVERVIRERRLLDGDVSGDLKEFVIRTLSTGAQGM